jgi:hypothetical protein
MKKSLLAAASVCVCLASCDRDKSIAGDPHDVPAAASEIDDTPPPVATRVIEPEEFKVAEEEPGSAEIVEPTPGQRLDHAIEKTEEGLGTAKEKTEEGLRRAAGATGGALRRAGDAIERKADEKSR